MEKKKKSKKKKPVYLLPVLGASILLLLSLGIFFFLQYNQDIKKVKPLGPQKILLVGNDLFVNNDVPNILRQIFKATSNKSKVEIKSIAIPDRNYDLGKHLGSSDLNELAKSDWDFVVLQDSTQAVLETPYEVLTNVRSIREKFKSDRTKFVFVSPFAEKEKETRQKVVSAVARKMCKNLSVMIAPLGEIFFMTQSQRADLSIYSPDNIKANSNGSFIIAATIYSTISGNAPTLSDSVLTYSYGGETKSMASFSEADRQIVSSLIASRVSIRNNSRPSGKLTKGSYSLMERDSKRQN